MRTHNLEKVAKRLQQIKTHDVYLEREALENRRRNAIEREKILSNLFIDGYSVDEIAIVAEISRSRVYAIIGKAHKLKNMKKLARELAHGNKQ